MEARRQRTIVFGGLVGLLAMVMWWQFGRAPSVQEPVRTAVRAPGSTPVPSTSQSQPSTSDAPWPAATAVPQVSIALLQQPRPEPADPGRDLFKFVTRPRPSDRGALAGPPGGSGAGGVPSSPGPVVPAETAPPPPPPIPLRFIGLVQKQGDAAKIAVLSDSRGVYHGREGDIIEGRYRIVRVGNESVELVYLDGRGRQVLRLSGA